MSLGLHTADSSKLKLSSTKLQTAASPNENGCPLGYRLFHSYLLYYGVLITQN